jgi:hypothetical protein
VVRRTKAPDSPTLDLKLDAANEKQNSDEGEPNGTAEAPAQSSARREKEGSSSGALTSRTINSLLSPRSRIDNTNECALFSFAFRFWFYLIVSLACE